MRVGRLFGIDVVVDWSWLIVAALMTLNLTSVFGHWHPGWALAQSLALACVATLLFFASILAHELAHALVATTLGMTVTSIRLFLFGGVSNIDREPPSAVGEFAMAIVGPILSIGVGLTFGFGAMLLLPPIDPAAPMRVFEHLSPIATLAVWLGPVNVGVGLFNLVPGFPLDGGRVLRAILWRITKDLDKATQIAATIGQFIGGSFIAIGVLRFFLGARTADSLWLAFIGWFLASAASRSYRALRVEEILEGMRVDQLMRRVGPLLSPDTTVRAFVEEHLVPTGQHAFAVVSYDGELVGLVTTHDVAKVDRKLWDATPLHAIMTPARKLAVTSPNEPLLGALRKLGEREVEQLPVVNGGALVGMLDRRELVHWLQTA